MSGRRSGRREGLAPLDQPSPQTGAIFGTWRMHGCLSLGPGNWMTVEARISIQLSRYGSSGDPPAQDLPRDVELLGHTRREPAFSTTQEGYSRRRSCAPATASAQRQFRRIRFLSGIRPRKSLRSINRPGMSCTALRARQCRLVQVTVSTAQRPPAPAPPVTASNNHPQILAMQRCGLPRNVSVCIIRGRTAEW